MTDTTGGEPKPALKMGDGKEANISGITSVGGAEIGNYDMVNINGSTFLGAPARPDPVHLPWFQRPIGIIAIGIAIGIATIVIAWLAGKIGVKP